MKKILLLLSVAWSTVLYGQGFYTDEGRLMDANGNEFVMKGMNIPLAWYQNDVSNSIDDIRNNTGSNAVRIVLQTNTPTNVWQSAVEACIENDMIPMVELHDVTGDNATSSLQQMADWWANPTRANFLTRPEIARYVLINVANEWSDWYLATPTQNPSNLNWRDAYVSAVQTIRNAGISTTLVVDAPGYGQDVDDAYNIRNYADEIMDADATALGGDPNILFSIHMYCEWRKGGDDISVIGTIKNSGIPIMVGEFGYQHATDGSCDIDEELIMSTAEQYDVGWLAWSQKGNSGGVEYLDLCNDWACASLSDWGNTVVNGSNGTKTATTASVFLSTTPTNVAPVIAITSPSNNSEVEVATEVVLTATATDSDGSVTEVEFFVDGNSIATITNAPYSTTWTPDSEGDYEITAVATDDDDATTTSTMVLVNVTATSNNAPLIAITSPVDEFVVEIPATVSIEANASDSDGSIAQVAFYVNDILISTDDEMPYEASWIPENIGTYTLTAVATDDLGAITTSDEVSVQIRQARAPYNGAPIAIPGTLQVEEYDLGGQDVAYYDNTPDINEAEVDVRMGEGVDLEIAEDIDGGYNLGYAEDGEWVEYTVDIAATGLYTLDFRHAADGTNGSFRLELDGIDVTDIVNVPNTGGWQEWDTFSMQDVALTEGEHVLRLVVISQYFNLNYITFTAQTITSFDELTAADIKIYPNPFSSVLNVETEANVNYQIINASGNMLESGLINEIGTIGEELSSGVYILKLISEEGVITQSVIKE